jgi:hypothetical protein
VFFSRELNTSHSSEDQHDWAVDKPEGESQPAATAAAESADTKYINAAYITCYYKDLFFYVSSFCNLCDGRFLNLLICRCRWQYFNMGSVVLVVKEWNCGQLDHAHACAPVV